MARRGSGTCRYLAVVRLIYINLGPMCGVWYLTGREFKVDVNQHVCGVWQAVNWFGRLQSKGLQADAVVDPCDCDAFRLSFLVSVGRVPAISTRRVLALPDCK